MPTTLAIESSTLTASVALVVDGELICEREEGVHSHSEVLLKIIDQCLRSAQCSLDDLTTIAIGVGPGSFTGLRIGMATAKGLCYAAGISLTPVSSLAAMAMDCFRPSPPDSIFVPILDAFRGEIYVGFFRATENTMHALAPDTVIRPEEFPTLAATYHPASLLLCGSGAAQYWDHLGSVGDVVENQRTAPSAASVAKLSQHLPACEFPDTVTPRYVRRPEVELKFPNGNTGGTFSHR